MNRTAKLSDRALKNLKPAPAGERYQIMDQLVPGFGVRVTDKGQRTFILRMRYPGSTNPNRRALGEYPILSLEDARAKATLWRTLVKRGLDPALVEARDREAEIRKRAITFGAVAEDWFRDKVASERKAKTVEREVRREFIPHWKGRPITEISDLDVLTIINVKKRSAPAQARNLLEHLKRFFGWAIDQRIYGLNASPCERLKPSKIIGGKRFRDRTLSDDELFALWRTAGRMGYPFGSAYRLLILTALRLNEAAKAFRPEIDFRAKIWTIPATRMKGKEGKARAHAVPLTADVLAIFESLPKFNKGRFLFSTTFGEKPLAMGSKIKAVVDARMLRTLRALARARGDDPAGVTLPRWTNHDIRRTVRSRLSRLKISEEAREAVLAHARPGIKGIYDHHDYLDEKRDALERWAARLKEIVIRDRKQSNVITLQA